MVFYNINTLRAGFKIIQNGEPCVVVENECIKPGKGQSFNRVRFRLIKSGKILEKTLKSGEFLQSANILELSLDYVYRDGDLLYFMDKKNFDQIAIQSQIVGENIRWLEEQYTYSVTFWENIPILVTPPHRIVLKVIKTDCMIKGTVTSSKSKIATVSTGATIKVPFFIQLGELIKINTCLGTYISRAK